jgi:PRC-barrel domain
MLEINDIREWRNHDVIDVDDHKIGTLESIYVDTTSDQPAFATVTVGVPTRRRLAFVPLAGASVGPGYLKVGHPQKQVKHAPSIDTDGELLAEYESAVFAQYELPYAPGAGGERRLARR